MRPNGLTKSPATAIVIVIVTAVIVITAMQLVESSFTSRNSK